ncbi:MAG: hypothetical protein B7Y74_15990 [Novosphingobium sp. 35-62-5]|nr:MAG: hypothetical protein B7Y74_15990 [Novosphingobium sp. 35-62-5]
MALVLTVAYLMLLLWPMMLVLEAAGLVERVPSSPLLRGLLVFNLASLLWRLAMRAMHSGREYGWTEGARALVRFPVGNVIAIMATQRALVAYVRVLSGQRLRWEHTVHRVHVVTACGGEDHSGAALPSAA